MSIPDFRTTRFQILPPVVKNLLIINGLLYLASVVVREKLGYDLADYLGLHFPTSSYFRPHQFVTHLFMHGSFMHLFSNMLALWMFGNVLENFWGPKKFLIYYLITGLGAALVHTLFTWYEIEQIRSVITDYTLHPGTAEFRLLIRDYIGYFDQDKIDKLNAFFSNWNNDPLNPKFLKESTDYAQMIISGKSDIPTVGASGAVFGILLAFGMLFPNVIIYVYFALPIKAKYLVILYGLFELFSGIQNNPQDNVAHFAHLGGMLFGYFLIRAWKKNQFQRFN